MRLNGAYAVVHVPNLGGRLQPLGSPDLVTGRKLALVVQGTNQIGK